MKKNSQNFENESAVELKKILTYQQLEEPIKKQDTSLADKLLSDTEKEETSEVMSKIRKGIEKMNK